MTDRRAADYRDNDRLGRGYCPRCFRAISIDTALFGVCSDHGKVPADFARPAGWVDPDDGVKAQTARELFREHYPGPTTDSPPPDA